MRQISVLLVEDEEPKRKHVQRFLDGLSISISLGLAASVNTALDYLERSCPDILLLDMSLPTFEVGVEESGGRPQPFGGIEVLRHMVLSDIFCPTIVITGYEAFERAKGSGIDLSQLRRELEQEFPSILKGVLHYNSTYDEWKTELNNALKEVDVGRGDKS